VQGHKPAISSMCCW